MKSIILSSSSPARQELLSRLGIPFKAAHPNIDETPRQNEPFENLVQRLALEKAQQVASQFENALIIGSDTVGVINKQLLCKPLTLENAAKQLRLVSKQSVRFLTGLCLFNCAEQTYQVCSEEYIVHYRELSDEYIKYYLNKADKSILHCAGSFQAEKLGITLVERFEGNDFTSLIGLPLIKLTSMLKEARYPI